MSIDFEDSICSSLSRSSLEENIANISMPSTFLESSKLTDDGSFMLTPSSQTCNYDNSNWSVNSLIDTPDKVVTKPVIRNSSLCSEIQLFRRLSQNVDNSRVRYSRTQLLINLMSEVFTSSTELPDDLKVEWSNKLQEFQLSTFLKNHPDVQKSIDIEIPVGKVEMSVHESDLLRSVLKKEMSVKCSQLKAENELISNVLNYQRNRVSLPGSILTEEEGDILSRISNITSLIEQCAQNFKALLNVYDELYEIRATKYRELQTAEMENLESKTKLLNLQLKNLNYAIEDAFVQQFDQMGEAVSVLYRELQVSLHEAEYMLQKTKSLKDKYDQIKGDKFNEILSEYCQLRDNYKHKAWALKQITGSQPKQ